MVQKSRGSGLVGGHRIVLCVEWYYGLDWRWFRFTVDEGDHQYWYIHHGARVLAGSAPLCVPALGCQPRQGSWAKENRPQGVELSTAMKCSVVRNREAGNKYLGKKWLGGWTQARHAARQQTPQKYPMREHQYLEVSIFKTIESCHVVGKGCEDQTSSLVDRSKGTSPEHSTELPLMRT